MPLYGHWTIFSLLLVCFFIAPSAWLTHSWRKKKPTEEEKKTSSLNCLKAILFWWLVDLFYMACFIGSKTWQFVFGSAIIISSMANAALSFSSNKAKTAFGKLGILEDFLVGVGFSVYLIYIIESPSLQTIILSMAAAVFGGLITLVGVGWTIKKADSDRRDELILREKPILSFTMLTHELPIDGTRKAVFPPLEQGEKYSCEVHVQLDNSDKSLACLKSIYHDGVEFPLDGNTIMLPSGNCLLSFRFNNPNGIFLEVRDSVDNPYFYALKVVALPNALNPAFTSSGRPFHTLREMKETAKKELDIAYNKSKDETKGE